MSRPARVVLAAWLALAWLLGGCATAGSPSAARDPLEPMNRAVFQFNDAVDRAVLKPVAQGYQDYIPENLRIAIGSVFGNVADLWTAVNQLLQGKPVEAVSDLSRFVLNSTLGLAGLADIATPAGLEKHHEDFGQTLGVWGVPAGPYLVLPLLGPSSPRDAVGMVWDMALSPFLWLDVPTYGLGLLNVVNSRAIADPEIERARATALDYYVFVRDAFQQNRAAAVANESQPSPAKGGGVYDDLYDLPDEE